ncbi:YciI family protein [Thalassovita gelatinovora]|uniref:YciI family protein n=1 Tax=Thalassovita gelatinovora TaxID=53501 RepID=UPI001FD00CBD|nr:YciI family protein [Thalassovita gelatinovora]
MALELFVVVSTPASGPEAVKATLPAHLAYQRKLEETGQLVLAGPLSDDSGNEMQGAGMIIYRAETMEAAMALAQADPMHSAKARNFTLRKWLVNEGALNMSVGLSTGRVSLS